MPIPLFGKLIKAFTGAGGIADAADIETSGGLDVQEHITRFLIAQRTGTKWLFESTTTAGASDNSMRFNNADPTLATAIYVDVLSEAGRIDEFMTSITENTLLLIQNEDMSDAHLFRITAPVVLQDAPNGYFEMTVTHLQNKGTPSHGDGDMMSFIFLPQYPTAVEAGFLDEVTLTSGQYNFSTLVQILDRNLTNVTLPVNAPYDTDARFMFAGATIESDSGRRPRRLHHRL